MNKIISLFIFSLVFISSSFAQTQINKNTVLTSYIQALRTQKCTPHKSTSIDNRAGAPMPAYMLTLDYNKSKSNFDTISKCIFYYDALNRNNTTITKQYFNGFYLDVSRQLYRYDKSNRLICSTNQIDNSGQYDNSDRDTCSYDEHGYQTIYMSQVFENNKWKTIKGNKSIFTYQNDHVSTQITQYADTSGKWVNDTKFVFSADNNGNIDEAIVYQWSDSTATWSEFVKFADLSLLNNDITRPISFTVQFSIGSSYINAQRLSATYNHDGLTLSTLTENYKNNKWINNTKESYNYDYLDNQGFYSYQAWDPTKNIWAIQSQNQNQYTYNGDEVTSNEYSTYNTQSQSWDIVNKLMYFYTNAASGILSVNTIGQFDAYPNPATDVLNIKLPDNNTTYTASITDISGKLILVEQLQQNNAQLNISNLKAGVYMLQLSSTSNTYNTRIIKK